MKFGIKYKIVLVLSLVMTGFINELHSQDSVKIKKLLQEVKQSKAGWQKSNLLFSLSKEFYNIDNEKSLIYAKKAYSEAKKAGNDTLSGKCCYMQGAVYEILGNKKQALENHQNGISIFEKLGHQEKMADGYVNIGNYFYGIGSNQKAIEYMEKALLIYEKLNIPSGIGYALNNLGAFNLKDKDNANALDFFKKALVVYESISDNFNIAATKVNIGNIYFSEKEYESAIKIYLEAIPFLEKAQDESTLASCMINLGVNYRAIGKLELASEYYKKAIVIFEKTANAEMLSNVYNNYSILLTELNRHEDAYNYLLLKIGVDDSLSNTYLMKQIAEMSEKYEADKRQQEIKLLTEEKKNKEQKSKIQDLENINQKKELEKSETTKSYSRAGVGLALLLALILLNRFRIKTKTNRQLIQQKEQILVSKQIIEEKNNDIMDSILYAQRIQDAILQEERKILLRLPENYIFFRPKDVVSGDFYWAYQQNDCWYAAVADCTGHGVPGAFMSLMGIAFLNEIIKNDAHKKPATILDELRNKVIRELGQSGTIGENRDGMDMTLVRYDSTKNLLEFAGANNPLLITTNDKLILLDADHQPVGYQSSQHPFTNHEYHPQKGDTLFLFSDGYPDQFGGPKIKKFKISKFKEMVQSNFHLPMEDQKKILEKSFDEWKGKNDQIDDVCVMAIRL